MNKNGELRIRLKKYIAATGVTQQFVADQIGVDRAVISRFLRGTGLTVDTWFALAAVMDREEMALGEQVKEPA
jgi:plasmid maintenance system antidote protein VapI